MAMCALSEEKGMSLNMKKKITKKKNNNNNNNNFCLTSKFITINY